MILPIVIDTQSLADQFSSLTPENINSMLDNIAKKITANFAEQLTKVAEQDLHSTRQRFINNIRVIDSGKLEGTVLLDYSKDKLIKMIEEGATAFDMKEGFLNSPKVKIGKKGGKYLTIPYRQATPTAIAESSAFAFKMSSAIYSIVKKKPTDIPVSGGGSRSKGLSLSELPAALQVKKKRPAIVIDGVVKFKEYEHKSAIAEGISKYNDPATNQNTYKSFRRVSENSDDEAWIHPGIEKHSLIQKALSQFQPASQLGEMIDIELSKLGLI